ncbi:hypothetical protein BCS42_16905 [Crenothrix sp. D3]|nr:hypothetical protein BCS42_16905 [Crenothrix sp. D3]
MRVFWAILGLNIPVILLYAPFLNNPLVFDDANFFYSENFNLYLYSLFSFDLRWLPFASFVWTRQLLGDGIIWLRLGNLLLHLITVTTLFFFLRRLFEIVIPVSDDDKTLSPFWLAFFGALLFALHPVAVYATGYLIQRTTLMATLFTLLTWRLFLEGLIREQRRWLTASALAYFLAVLSKEHAIMAPALTLALLFLVSSQPLSRIKFIGSTLVLYTLIGTFVVIQRQSEHILGQIYEPYSAALLASLSKEFDPRLAYPLSILTQSFTFFKYLWVWLVPSPALMSIDNCQTFALRLWSLPEILGLVGFIIYAIVAVRLLLQRGLTGLLGFALLCPLLLFFTELATVRLQEIFVLYRSYLWMVGLFAGLPFVCQRLTAKQAVIILSGIALLMMPLTWVRLTTFSHPLLLWDDAARRIDNDNTCPMMIRILNNRGSELIALDRYSESIDDFNRIIKAANSQQKTPVVYAATYYNRGVAYLKTQQFQLALDDFNRIKEPPAQKAWRGYYYHKAQALEGLHDLTQVRELYEKSCLNGMTKSCDRLKELEETVK